MNNQTPMPPVPPSHILYKTIQFWSGILATLDKQVQYMEENHCYGKITVDFKFWNGKLVEKGSTILVTDKVIEDGSAKST